MIIYLVIAHGPVHHVWKLISQEILRFFCLPGLFSDLWMLWSRLGSCSTEMTRMHQFLNTVLLSWHNRFIGMLCERNWDGCSIFFFTILYILPGIRLQSGWSVFTSAFPLSLSLPVFVSLLVSYEIPQTVEHSLSTSFLSKEALLLASYTSALKVVTWRHGWLLISCWSHKRALPCWQFSHAQLFLQKKKI